MYLKDFRIYNSRLLRKLTWSNRIDRVCNGVLMKCYVPHFQNADKENQIYIEALKTAAPMIESETRALKVAHQDYRESKYDGLRLLLLGCALQELKDKQIARHQYLTEQIEEAKQYRKGL